MLQKTDCSIVFRGAHLEEAVMFRVTNGDIIRLRWLLFGKQVVSVIMKKKALTSDEQIHEIDRRSKDILDHAFDESKKHKYENPNAAKRTSELTNVEKMFRAKSLPLADYASCEFFLLVEYLYTNIPEHFHPEVLSKGIWRSLMYISLFTLFLYYSGVIASAFSANQGYLVLLGLYSWIFAFGIFLFRLWMRLVVTQTFRWRDYVNEKSGQSKKF